MAYVWIFLACSGWGLIGLFTSNMAQFSLSSTDILWFKACFTLLFMGILIGCKEPARFRLKHPRHLLYFFGTGILSFSYFSWAYMQTILMTDTGIAAVLLYTCPAIVMVYSALFLGERFTKRKSIALGATLLGCACVAGVFGGNTSVSTAGVLMGLSSGFGYALYSIFSGMALRHGYTSFTILFYTFLFATLGLSLLYSPIVVLRTVHTNGAWVYCIAFTACTTILPYLTYTKGLSMVRASVASLSATLEPVIASLLGIFILHEDVSFMKVFGMILVLGSVMLVNAEGLFSKRKKT